MMPVRHDLKVKLSTHNTYDFLHFSYTLDNLSNIGAIVIVTDNLLA